MQITPYDAQILALAALFGAAGVLIKVSLEIRKFLKHAVEEWKDFAGMPASFSELKATVQEIKKEVKPNSGSSLRDSVDRIEGAVAVIGARQDAQVSLSEDVWWEADVNGMVTRANKKFGELVGRDEREVLGANWKNTVHPDDIEKLARDWSSAVADKRDTEFCYRVIRPTGEVIPVQAKSTAKRDVKGNLIGWFGTVVVRVEQEGRTMAREGARKLPRVLIVDDDVDSTIALKLAFQDCYDVAIANSGGAALQHWNANRALGVNIDAILLDYTMPEMDGLTVTRRIREAEGSGPHVAIFFLSGASQSIPQEQRELYKVEAVLTKPCLPMEIRQHIDSYLNRRL